MTEKGKVPLVGVEPNASHLSDKHPRLLDHGDFFLFYVETNALSPLIFWCFK